MNKRAGYALAIAAVLGTAGGIVATEKAKNYPSQEDFQKATASGTQVNADTCTTGLTTTANFSLNNMARLMTAITRNPESMMTPQQFQQCATATVATIARNNASKDALKMQALDFQRIGIISDLRENVRSIYGDSALQQATTAPVAPAVKKAPVQPQPPAHR